MAVELVAWTRQLSGRLGELAPNLRIEARRLLVIAQRHAPSRIATGLYEQQGRIFSKDPQAAVTSTGGWIRPLTARWLRIPLPGQPKNAGSRPGEVTFPRGDGFKRYVKDKRTDRLVAVRVKAVRIRGTRWMDRALAEYFATAQQQAVRGARIKLGVR